MRIPPTRFQILGLRLPQRTSADTTTAWMPLSQSVERTNVRVDRIRHKPLELPPPHHTTHMDLLAPLLGRTLVIVAHPDDEAVACAALLQRMREAHVLFCTDGGPLDPW